MSGLRGSDRNSLHFTEALRLRRPLLSSVTAPEVEGLFTILFLASKLVLVLYETFFWPPLSVLLALLRFRTEQPKIRRTAPGRSLQHRAQWVGNL